MIIIMIFQVLLLLLLLVTFKYENNIWSVFITLVTFIPLVGLIVNLAVLIVGYINTLDNPTNFRIIRDNKLNRWLYAGYFKNNS